MRTGFVLAALAATSFALPKAINKRDEVVVYETETDIVWVTALVTVTASPVEAIVAPTTTSSAVIDAATGRRNHGVAAWTWSGDSTYSVIGSPTHTTRGPWRWTTTTAPAVQTSTVVVPPAPVTTSTPEAQTTTAAPVPVTTTTTTPAPQPQPTTTSTSTTSTEPATTQSKTAASAKPTTYEQLIVAHHNLHRANHSAPDLAWDTALANTAAKIAASCSYGHNTGMDRDVIGGYGQNIAAGVPASNISLIITDYFYNGEVGWYSNLYGQAQPDMTNFEHWGHFSQIVWRDTVKIGCATQQCSSLANVDSRVPPYFTVCNYQAPGNMQGSYTEVGSPLGFPTAHWDYFN